MQYNTFANTAVEKDTEDGWIFMDGHAITSFINEV